ncbi:hypothetical protein M1L60_25555 [Actinoplanes sp. TRM 88003]|uniref:Transmembrane protein n=1 Tax=Paractinoplanes aksuensis TaxID=2939490 RepID=A0ABT1DVI5_9ACTN|nr:hypothetical protein [Actinoplanes aksuensis]MCO8273970.1 hypothetical protein [Actinoplanes aksuensis]
MNARAAGRGRALRGAAGRVKAAGGAFAGPTMALHGVAALVTAVVLAPLVRPGYVLRYDMVFVPRQPLNWEMLAPADSLPRAVPLDALVSVANLAVPGWLLQRIALVAVVYLAALGAARLMPAERLGPRVVAALAYAWTPFLAERLLLGQWALLLTYATLPWLVLAARDLRAGGRDRASGVAVPPNAITRDADDRKADAPNPEAGARNAHARTADADNAEAGTRNAEAGYVGRPGRGALARLVLAAAPAAVTPTGGLIALAAVLVLLPLRSRMTAIAVASVVGLNAPWLVAALTGPAGGVSDPEGVPAFAARAENWAGAWWSLAGTGGIWNAQTVPESRASVLTPLATLLVLAIAAAGLSALRRALGDRLLILAAGGFLLAAAGAGPGEPLLEWIVGNVPGGGLLRDGQKFLIPYALVLALAFAAGAGRLAGALARRFEAPAGRMLLIGAALLPVALLPDLAFGALGALRPVSYPADWNAVAKQVDARPGEVLSLPFEGYQRYRWTDGVVVRDPAPRYLDAPVLINDALRVGAVTVDGESPRAAMVGEHLAAGKPSAELGFRWVLVRLGSGNEPPADVLTGLRLAYAGPGLQLWENPAAPPAATAGADRRLMALTAHGLAAVLVIFYALTLLRVKATPW